jgi:hypothetical protein
MSTQNKVLAKVTLRFIAVDLMSYFSSTKSSETSVTATSLISKRENFPNFLYMNGMHTSLFYVFVAYKSGMLQKGLDEILPWNH